MSKKVFVAKFSHDTTDAELRELFSAAGAVASVVVPTDRQTGQKRGFAFIDFQDEGSAEEAIRRFNNYNFKGRTIVVTEARPPQPGPSRFRPNSSRPSSPRPGGFSRPAPTGERSSRESDKSLSTETRRPQRSRKRKFGDPKKSQPGEFKAPRGPIAERRTDRFFYLGDSGEDEEIPDFDNVATSADEENED